MAVANRYQKTDRQVFFDEINSSFPDCAVEMDPRGRIWVFSYPTPVMFSQEEVVPVHNNVLSELLPEEVKPIVVVPYHISEVKEAIVAIHNFLIQSI